MDDYHEFKHAYEIQIEECRLYQSPNYVFITKGIVALGGAMTTPNNLRSGNGSASGNGATGSGGTTRGGVIGHPLVHKVHCLNLTQLWNSSVMDCDGITR